MLVSISLKIPSKSKGLHRPTRTTWVENKKAEKKTVSTSAFLGNLWKAYYKHFMIFFLLVYLAVIVLAVFSAMALLHVNF